MTDAGLHSPFQALHFDNRFVRELPGDEETINQPRQVWSACYSRVSPVKASAPKLVAWSAEMVAALDLPVDTPQLDEFVQVFSGNQLLPGMEPHATCYGGHQFGNWAGQLGDGRAINLGETVNRAGQRWVLQLKGAGPTPYCRMADGYAVLRSSVREFLCSEAMHHLGVPTTRALSLITTGDQVMRDMFYDGNARPEPGAVVCRVAPSFTRFGSFQIFTARQEFTQLRQLVDFTIRTDFPHLGEPSPENYHFWFHEICRLTAELMVHWMRVGFVHGVMNTDNMSVLGLTIDYGPYGWLEGFEPSWTPNTTDLPGRRYCFANQPQIASWNLAQLAQAIYPLTEQVEPLQDGLTLYARTFEQGWNQMMVSKLGLARYQEDDDKLLTELLAVLQQVETDMTLFYRLLARLTLTPAAGLTDRAWLSPLQEAFYLPEQQTDDKLARLADWIRAYARRVQLEGVDDSTRRQRMDAVNPKYVLRNYLAQEAIDLADQGDFSRVRELLQVLRKPYAEQPEYQHYANKRPEWARHRAGCSMLSCSS